MLKNRKCLACALLLMALVGSLSAQSLINTSGNSVKTEKVQLQWSIGEVAIESLIGNSVILTQGVHQVWMDLVSVQTFSKDDFTVKAYPNPVRRELQIELQGNKPANMELRLYGVAGKLVYTKKISMLEEQLAISFSRYDAGIYHLILLNSSGEKLKNLKLIKY